MEYQKKTAVFKQVEKNFSLTGKTLGGIARIETLSGESDFYLSLINFCSTDGEYACFIVDASAKVFKFSLPRRPSSSVFSFCSPPDLSSGFAAGVVMLRNDIPLTVAFARSEECSISLSDFKKAIAAFILNELRLKPKDKPPAPKAENKEIAPCEEQAIPPKTAFYGDYNDEAVATVNYFDFDKEIDDKLKKVKEKDNGKLRFENELSSTNRQADEREELKSNSRAQNEADPSCSQIYSDKNPYYDTVRQELEGIFLSFPSEECLEKAFEQSKFSKIYYSEGKYYVVGVIKENQKERYVCYGVPATYSPEPPKELKGFCSFIPLSVFDLKGDGYWMIFQDAVTGKCIRPE